jgi:hypothetical protein
MAVGIMSRAGEDGQQLDNAFTWSVAMLALGHLGSVFLHQGTRSNTMARMGIRGVSTASRE